MQQGRHHLRLHTLPEGKLANGLGELSLEGKHLGEFIDTVVKLFVREAIDGSVNPQGI
jgi:hypothetical protein